MHMQSSDYTAYVKSHARRSPTARNCLFAFTVGGTICALGEILRLVYERLFGIEAETSGTLVSVSLILLSVTLTALGLFDRIAKHGGAGTLVPITGFANAVSSPAIDSRAEGMILGLGANMFKVAGPVIVYGIVSGCVYGVVYYVIKLIM